ncbi:MAG: transcription antitermination factor NusB [Verrucomicrobia bacterium]|nr:transcription antitermination factor NusB [Verrucomicrobiota bacterium]MDA1066777.1 transcription antitermination factor NusB [Verrucomicrobiota bacterium]
MSKTPRRRENRIAALQFLYACSLNPPDDLVDQLSLFFSGKDRERDYYAFSEELIHGVLENLDEVDEVIKTYAENWDFDRIAKMDLSILRLAIFELQKRLDIPPIVSINEAIELSKEFSGPDSKRFINGILDKMKSTIQRPLREATEL